MRTTAIGYGDFPFTLKIYASYPIVSSPIRSAPFGYHSDLFLRRCGDSSGLFPPCKQRAPLSLDPPPPYFFHRTIDQVQLRKGLPAGAALGPALGVECAALPAAVIHLPGKEPGQDGAQS